MIGIDDTIFQARLVDAQKKLGGSLDRLNQRWEHHNDELRALNLPTEASVALNTFLSEEEVLDGMEEGLSWKKSQGRWQICYYCWIEPTESYTYYPILEAPAKYRLHLLNGVQKLADEMVNAALKFHGEVEEAMK